MSSHLFVIIDYNLSRIEDVQIMTHHAKTKRGLTTVLVRKSPGAIDLQLADHVIDLDPLAPSFVDEAIIAIRALGTPAAVLPFSDNAVASGAAVAQSFEVLTDSADLAAAAFSKIAYRKCEDRLLATFPQKNFEAPKWQEVSSLEEVEDFAKKTAKGFVIKPSCEGNNRGVIKVLPGDDLAAAFAEVKPYISHGALCEEFISLPDEYSFDGIGSLTFITKKNSANGRYPVEYGQTVPARLEPSLEESIRKAGAIANVIVGQRIGPFHNEIKLDPVTGMTAVIEPNRRPAGMRIWHLARKVFGVDFFELWVDIMLGHTPHIDALIPCGTASVRMLKAPHKGRLLASLNEKDILASIVSRPKLQELTKRYRLEWSDFSFMALAGTFVTEVLEDNSKFIAQVSVYAPDNDTDVSSILSVFEDEWSAVAAGLIVPESQATGGML